MPTIFSQIIQGTIPSHKLYEDDRYYCFLDIRPISEGHSLVIPKVEVDYIFDLEDDLLSGMMPVAKKLARALKHVVSCERVGILVAGLEVPHAHLHLVPITSETQLSFEHATPANQDDLARLAETISAVLN